MKVWSIWEGAMGMWKTGWLGKQWHRSAAGGLATPAFERWALNALSEALEGSFLGLTAVPKDSAGLHVHELLKISKW